MRHAAEGKKSIVGCRVDEEFTVGLREAEKVTVGLERGVLNPRRPPEKTLCGNMKRRSSAGGKILRGLLN